MRQMSRVWSLPIEASRFPDLLIAMLQTAPVCPGLHFSFLPVLGSQITVFPSSDPTAAYLADGAYLMAVILPSVSSSCVVELSAKSNRKSALPFPPMRQWVASGARASASNCPSLRLQRSSLLSAVLRRQIMFSVPSVASTGAESGSAASSKQRSSRWISVALKQAFIKLYNICPHCK